MSRINVLMVGTGEYTTGYVDGAPADSDKGAGVVALTLFDLRRRGKLGELSMAGTNGAKFPYIRQHLQRMIGDVYGDMDIQFTSFPSDDCAQDTLAYQRAIEQLLPGDAVIVFTPDDTHFEIAMTAVRAGCHVLIAKPIVKTVEEHLALSEAAEARGVLVAMEVHKRWDPIYADARDRIRELGEFSHFYSYMSQPKTQLRTFRHWAGKSSDISYYLNAHHVDFNVWSVAHMARPLFVHATAAQGHADAQGIPTEDTIVLTVTWENMRSGSLAAAVYTASWIAPKSDVHSQQRFFYMGHQGEVHVDQAHRGYTLATDAMGFASVNPLFMKYAPDSNRDFAGQTGYGYRSIEAFLEAAAAVRDGRTAATSFSGKLATADDTLLVTAILEAGRRSLDEQGSLYAIQYDSEGQVAGLARR